MPQHRYEMLARVKTFHEVATLAGEHHERLDGTGYPYRRTAEELTTESRLIAVADMYSALVESRPYRKDLSRREVLEIMQREVPDRLDAECFEVLREATAAPAPAEAIAPAALVEAAAPLLSLALTHGGLGPGGLEPGVSPV